MREFVAEYRYGYGHALYNAGGKGGGYCQSVCKVVDGVTNYDHNNQRRERWKDDIKIDE